MEDIILSSYQEAILNEMLHGHGNMLIQAYAGAGKTYMMKRLIKAVPNDASKIYLAFNTSISLDFGEKVRDVENLTNKTIHSLGFSIIRNNNKGIDIEVDENKYKTFIRNNIENISKTYFNLTYNKKTKFRTNVNDLVRYARQSVCDGKKCMEELCKKYCIKCLGDEIECALVTLKWGKDDVETIDYVDMEWLPNVKPYRFPSYDYVFVDEAQDLTVAQQEIVKKCRNIRTRFVFCGDINQTIYAFKGSDAESFNNFAKFPNTKIFDLPICYRCDRKIISMAQQIVFGIKPREDANDGTIISDATINDINDNDVILCRNNAPLMKLYFTLIENGRKVYFVGKDTFSDLIEMVENTNKSKLNQTLDEEGVFSTFYLNLLEKIEYIKMIEQCDETYAIQNSSIRDYYDKIQTLHIIASGLKTAEELIQKIKQFIDDETTEGIRLSTVHKAKGLEFDSVVILNKSLFNSNAKRTNSDALKQQERNLLYVAITRAKKTLKFIEDEDFLKSDMYLNLESLSIFEYKINQLYGITKSLKTISKEYANEVINNFREIEEPNKTNVVHGLSHMQDDKSKPRNLSILLKKKIKKIKI